MAMPDRRHKSSTPIIYKYVKSLLSSEVTPKLASVESDVADVKKSLDVVKESISRSVRISVSNFIFGAGIACMSIGIGLIAGQAINMGIVTASSILHFGIVVLVVGVGIMAISVTLDILRMLGGIHFRIGRKSRSK